MAAGTSSIVTVVDIYHQSQKTMSYSNVNHSLTTSENHSYPPFTVKDKLYGKTIEIRHVRIITNTYI